MRHETVTAEIQETAALYSAGVLEPELADEFRSHVKSGCQVCASELSAFESTAAELASMAGFRKPPANLEHRLMNRITSTDSPLRVLTRAEDGAWQPSGVPGVSLRQLFLDPNSGNVTMLVKLNPGAVYPSHRHHSLEHCYVLEGDLVFHDHTLNAGDYEVAMPSTAHSTVSSVHGCVLLIINNLRDEALT